MNKHMCLTIKTPQYYLWKSYTMDEPVGNEEIGINS